MRIGDDNLLEIMCRVECPSIGSHNTIGARARLHHTLRLLSYCAVGPACLVVPLEDEILEDYSVVYTRTEDGEEDAGTNYAVAAGRKWSGRGKVQEADLRTKHAEYLREMLPKFNRMRRTEAQ